jgi:hypothetical protein
MFLRRRSACAEPLPVTREFVGEFFVAAVSAAAHPDRKTDVSDVVLLGGSLAEELQRALRYARGRQAGPGELPEVTPDHAEEASAAYVEHNIAFPAGTTEAQLREWVVVGFVECWSYQPRMLSRLFSDLAEDALDYAMDRTAPDGTTVRVVVEDSIDALLQYMFPDLLEALDVLQNSPQSYERLLPYLLDTCCTLPNGPPGSAQRLAVDLLESMLFSCRAVQECRWTRPLAVTFAPIDELPPVTATYAHLVYDAALQVVVDGGLTGAFTWAPVLRNVIMAEAIFGTDAASPAPASAVQVVFSCGSWIGDLSGTLPAAPSGKGLSPTLLRLCHLLRQCEESGAPETGLTVAAQVLLDILRWLNLCLQCIFQSPAGPSSRARGLLCRMDDPRPLSQLFAPGQLQALLDALMGDCESERSRNRPLSHQRVIAMEVSVRSLRGLFLMLSTLRMYSPAVLSRVAM